MPLDHPKICEMFLKKTKKERKKQPQRDIFLGGIVILIGGRADTVQAVPTALEMIPTGKEYHEDSRIYCNDSIRGCRAPPMVGI